MWRHLVEIVGTTWFCLKPRYMKNTWAFCHRTHMVCILWQVLGLINFWARGDPQGPGGGAQEIGKNAKIFNFDKVCRVVYQKNRGDK